MCDCVTIEVTESEEVETVVLGYRSREDGEIKMIAEREPPVRGLVKSFGR